MKLNRKWFLVIALVLSLTMATGGTLAYLTATDSETNTFTVGNVDIDLTEPEYDGDNQMLLPGVTIDKDPMITNTGNTDAWVWMKIEMPIALYNTLEIDWNKTDWIWSVVPSDGKAVVTMKWEDKLAVDGKTEKAFTKVSIDEKVTDLSDLGNGTVDIKVTAYAIQDSSFDNINAAIAAYNGETGGTPDNEPTGTAVNNAEALTAALEAGGDVYLSEDVTVTSGLTVPAGKSANINLNGHNLSYAVSNAGASAIITNKGNLELSGVGTLSYVAANPDLNAIPSYATNTITNTGNGILTINEGVTITNGSDGGASYAVDVQSGKFVMNGGTLKGDRCALRIARFNADTEFVMNGGTVTAKTPAWIHLPGSDASVAPSIKVTINDGTFKTTKASSADNDVLYTYSFGNSHAKTTIDIKGGQFLGGTVSIGSGYYGDAPSLTITGGTFDYDVLKWTSDENSVVV